jgi:trans-aconitate methyltransferase
VTRPPIDDWEEHWGAYGASAADNPAQRYRRHQVFAELDKAGTPTRLVDIGAGQGDLLEKVSQRWAKADLLGLELSAAGIAEGHRKVPHATFLQRNLLKDEPVPHDVSRWATHAVCSEVLEHVDDPLRLLLNARSYLAPGCQLVVTVPAGPRSAFDKHIGHRKHYRRQELAALLGDAGFESVTVRAAGFPVFNLYKLLVVARGKRLITEVSRQQDGASETTTALVAMRTFDRLFRFAASDSRWGWQLVGIATEP